MASVKGEIISKDLEEGQQILSWDFTIHVQVHTSRKVGEKTKAHPTVASWVVYKEIWSNYLKDYSLQISAAVLLFFTTFYYFLCFYCYVLDFSVFWSVITRVYNVFTVSTTLTAFIVFTEFTALTPPFIAF